MAQPVHKDLDWTTDCANQSLVPPLRNQSPVNALPLSIGCPTELQQIKRKLLKNDALYYANNDASLIF